MKTGAPVAPAGFTSSHYKALSEVARELFPLQIAGSLESKAKAKLVRLHQDIFSCSISSLETPA